MNKPVGTLEPEVNVLTAPHVLQAINSVMSDVAREGIGKDRKNEAQGYKFRGIDDVYNALAPILARNHLVITPRCLSRAKEMVPTKSGGSMFYVNVEMEFELSSAIDGSTLIARMYGEAMDSGDKATNKAMSAAYKYMAMQTFCIPTEGDNDADAHTHQIAQSSSRERDATAEEMAENLLRGCGSREMLKDAWTRNEGGWRGVMDEAVYLRLKGLTMHLVKQFDAPPKPAPAEGFDTLNGDEIPF